ncbi:PREDICTED: aminopeptidase N-like [Vollenhovia emeryi]|uniref:aminopeptidase N-like n=1 Tax=Vollenhovia emeryi TaxID=411798 RepID=UPI0005F52955|nr:PREDICTED: aminopeptidase N-like [Vollenhovia emeryi]
MIHHYVSNLVIQTWWSYLWLNEGIATFLAMEIVRETVHFHYTDLLTVQLLYDFFHLNDYYNMSLVSEIIEPSDIISPFPFTYYIKAPIFIYALVHTVTIYPFLQGLNAYLSMHKLRSIDSSNNTFDMFLNILQNDEISPELNINLTEKLSQWTTQERYTVLQVTRQKGNRTEIKLLQEYLNQSYSKNLWIPVTYTMQNSSEFEYKKWLSPQEPILHLTDVDSNQWIIVNVDRAGYHRVNYDYDNWQKLITCLHSETYYYISVRNRAQIIDDAYYFLLNNKLDFSLFKNLTNYLSNDINYAVWYPVFKIMEEISGVFPFQRSAEIKSHFQKILDSLLNKLEYSNKEGDNDFIKCLRQEAAKWACILRSSQCTATARFYLNWLYDQSRPIVPGWMEWIHCKGMMNADRSLWEKAMDASLTNKKLIKFLVCSENYVIIMDYIDRLKSEIYFTKAQDRIEVFHSIIARHAKKNVILDYILKHFTNIIYRDIKILVALTDIINHLYSEDQLSKIYKYMQSTLSNKMSQKMSSYVLQKIKVRSLEIARCTLHFKNLLR